MNPGTFAAVFVALYASHCVGDLVVQTDAQARGKTADKGWVWPMAGHLGGYWTSQAVALVTLQTAGVHISPWATLVGLIFSVATHGFIDRRWPVRWLLEHTGSADFVRLASNGLNGAYLTDQALHVGCLFVAALIIGGAA